MISSVMLWTLTGSFETRMEAAALAGFDSVELVGEYASWPDSRIAEVKRLCRSFGLGKDMLLATPDWDKRPVSMVDPAQRQNFLDDVNTAIRYARELEISQILLLSGNAIPGRTYEEQFASVFEGARRAGDLAAKAGLILALEPLNSLVDRKGFFLNSCVEGLRLIRQVDHPHVRLLFDVYHEQVQAGNTIRTLTEASPWVTAFHVADNPGRHEPGTGEINYSNVYKAMREAGFKGHVAMEYFPAGEQVASLTNALNAFHAAVNA